MIASFVCNNNNKTIFMFDDTSIALDSVFKNSANPFLLISNRFLSMRWRHSTSIQRRSLEIIITDRHHDFTLASTVVSCDAPHTPHQAW